MGVLIAMLFIMLRLLGFAVVDLLGGLDLIAEGLKDPPPITVIVDDDDGSVPAEPSNPNPGPHTDDDCSGHPGNGLPKWCR